MTAQTSYPVIQIIDSDKKYVGSLATKMDLQSPIRQHKSTEGGYDPAQRCWATSSNRYTLLQKITSFHSLPF
jgi:hypothetical protein